MKRPCTSTHIDQEAIKKTENFLPMIGINHGNTKAQIDSTFKLIQLYDFQEKNTYMRVPYCIAGPI